MPDRRVLVVGIDGVRLDTLRRLPTPHLDALTADGFLTPVEVDDATPTMSGPCWATVVTGVGVAKHGVWSNDLTGHRLDVFPDFATRLDHHDGRRTFVAAGWRPLLQPRDGGPLFRAPSRTVCIAPRADTPEAWEECDERVTEAAARVLAEDDVDASFVYLGAPDETAHVLGCAEAYDTAVRRADTRLGRLLDAVRSRPGHGAEEWTYLVVTDHGHAQAGGHGGRSAAERTAWLAAAGPGIGAAPRRPVRHTDVAAQVYAALGRHPDRHWTLDGRPFAARPHAVLLDLDGTLADTESLWLRTVRETAPAITTDDLFATLGRSVTDTAAHLHTLTGTDPGTLAADLETRFATAVQQEAAPLPGALELLALLHDLDIPAAAVSASPRPVVDAVLKMLDVRGAPAFAATVAAGETRRTKPAPDPYLAAARALGADPASCLAVEDSPTGVTAAEAAGCRVLAVPSYTPIDPAPGRTVRRGLSGLGITGLWAAGL